MLRSWWCQNRNGFIEYKQSFSALGTCRPSPLTKAGGGRLHRPDAPDPEQGTQNETAPPPGPRLGAPLRPDDHDELSSYSRAGFRLDQHRRGPAAAVGRREEAPPAAPEPAEPAEAAAPAAAEGAAAAASAAQGQSGGEQSATAPAAAVPAQFRPAEQSRPGSAAATGSAAAVQAQLRPAQ